MQSAAKHAAPYGVRVNAILPGIIRTAMWEEILEGMNNGWDPEVHNEDVYKRQILKTTAPKIPGKKLPKLLHLTMLPKTLK